MDKKTPLTPEEKKQILLVKIQKMKSQVKQIDSTEKKQERKDRARELIQIGAIVSQFHDRKQLLKQLQEKPQFIYIADDGQMKKTSNIQETTIAKRAVFIDPKTAIN